MFTGLIKAKGRVEKLKSNPKSKGLRLKISYSPKAFEVRLGDSISINGVCLTVVKRSKKGVFSVEISPETLARTNLGRLKESQIVNLEPALLATDRLGGHFVLGHIDAVGRIESLQKVGKFYRIRISYPNSYAPLLIEKGSIAVDGISLTVNHRGDSTFDVMVIPHTWAETTMNHYHKGLAVNLEFDILGKYLYEKRRSA